MIGQADARGIPPVLRQPQHEALTRAARLDELAHRQRMAFVASIVQHPAGFRTIVWDEHVTADDDGIAGKTERLVWGDSDEIGDMLAHCSDAFCIEGGG